MKLYTKRGDDGRTSLASGPRVAKDDLRVSAYGEVDELNAVLGLVAAACPDPDWTRRFHRVQGHLFSLGALLADPREGASPASLAENDITELERWVDAADEETAPLRNFILPGGCELAARLHLARTVCRRAERAVVRLAQNQPVACAAVPFLNRLSDLLFAWARLANVRAGAAEVVWHPSATGDPA